MNVKLLTIDNGNSNPNYSIFKIDNGKFQNIETGKLEQLIQTKIICDYCKRAITNPNYASVEDKYFHAENFFCAECSKSLADQKFFKEVPMVDEMGNEIPWNPPLTDSFWEKPKTTSDILNEYTKKYKKKPRK